MADAKISSPVNKNHVVLKKLAFNSKRFTSDELADAENEKGISHTTPSTPAVPIGKPEKTRVSMLKFYCRIDIS